MNDVLPEACTQWRYIESIFSQSLRQYGYQEIRMPLVENTQLFKRSVGEVTDIVEKEMYTFNDMNGDSISLRPEGTAGCVRACLENGLLHNQQPKLWYYGPMFRHEKPQKGRYRQFNQLGVEAFGIEGAAIELELITIANRFWKSMGVAEHLELEINTLGSIHERQLYREKLIGYFNENFNGLDEDSKRRLHTNPLRILDSKNPQLQALISSAPQLTEYMGEDSLKHFADVCDGLKSLGISFRINPVLVRGLDYYAHTVFEWVTDKLGSQATVCAGGRYDYLVEQLGGNHTPAVGFAVGIERLQLLRETLNVPPYVSSLPSVYFIAAQTSALNQALLLAESLRDKNPLWEILVCTGGGSFKSQFKKADKSGARLALIIGEDEMRDKTISIKDLRHSSEQKTIAQHELAHHMQHFFQD